MGNVIAFGTEYWMMTKTPIPDKLLASEAEDDAHATDEATTTLLIPLKMLLFFVILRVAPQIDSHLPWLHYALICIYFRHASNKSWLYSMAQTILK